MLFLYFTVKITKQQHLFLELVKFIYSEKAKKFCEISTLLLSYVMPVKSKLEISQNFVVFSEYMNFKLKKFISAKQIACTMNNIYLIIVFCVICLMF